MAEKMLRAVPDGWFSYNFTIFNGGGASIARAVLSKWYWRETTKLRIGVTSYEAHRKERPGKEYNLKNEDDRVVAMTDKPNFWRNRWVVEHGDDQDELKKEPVRRNTFLLWHDGAEPVGFVRSKGLLKRERTAKLTEGVPSGVAAFILWLLVIRWKQKLSSAVAGRHTVGGGG